MTKDELLSVMNVSASYDADASAIMDQISRRAISGVIAESIDKPELTPEQFELRKNNLISSGADVPDEILDATYEDALEMMNSMNMPRFQIVATEPRADDSIMLIPIQEEHRRYYLPEGLIATNYLSYIIQDGLANGKRLSILYTDQPCDPFWMGLESYRAGLKGLLYEESSSELNLDQMIDRAAFAASSKKPSLISLMVEVKSYAVVTSILNKRMDGELFRSLDLMKGVYGSEDSFYKEAKQYAIEKLLPKHFDPPKTFSEETVRMVLITAVLVNHYFGAQVLAGLLNQAGTIPRPLVFNEMF